MIKGIYAVQLKTANFDALRKFYSKTLGLSVNHTCAGCAIMEIGGEFWLTIQRNPQAARDLGETSPVSVAFLTDDVEALYKRVTGEGAKSASAPQEEPWGAISATVLDPDGNKVILIEPKPGAGKAARCCARRAESPDVEPAPAAKGKPKAKA